VAKHRKPKIPPLQGQAASNLPVRWVDSTSEPAPPDTPTTATWGSRQSTNAPQIGEPDTAEGYSASAPELAHRFLSGKLKLRLAPIGLLIPVGWLAVVAWMFQQDNAAGLLQTWSGMKWFLLKSLLLGVACLTAGAVLLCLRWLASRTAGDAT